MPLLCISVIYDILEAQKLLTNKSFMKHNLIDTVLRVFGTISMEMPYAHIFILIFF